MMENNDLLLELRVFQSELSLALEVVEYIRKDV